MSQPLDAAAKAPWGPRLAAGAIDAVATLLVAAILVGLPWRLGGFTLPMIGALAAVVGWSVAPLAAFGVTVGMRLMGLEMVGPDGRRPDAIEVAFRELVGRGLLPAAYLVVVAAGLASMLLGRGDFHAPARLGLLFISLSGVGIVAAGLGHFLVLSRPDGRGLADLLGRTRVVLKAMPTQALDEDERREHQAAGRTVRRAFVLFEIGLAAVALAVPFVLGRPVEAHATQNYADRLMRERAEQLFNANPGDADLARDLVDRCERQNDLAAAQRVRERHRVAFAGLERAREVKLRESLARDPRDDSSVEALLVMLERQGRLDDARQVARASVEAAPSPQQRVWLGAWLQRHGFAAEAIKELRAALDEGETGAETYAYLGLALREVGRTEEAQEAIGAALALEPDQEIDVRSGLGKSTSHDAGLPQRD
jgi:uncharacterized RDD family membrane protein YckC